MNDSLYGELAADGVPASDIGSVPFPGTDGSFLAIIDTFVAAKDARNGANALQFLAVIGSAPTELAFAKVKGSAPLRSDVDAAALPAYQQSAFTALHEDTILLSITHGERLAPQFQQAIYDGVAAFAQTRDPKDFVDRTQRAYREPCRRATDERNRGTHVDRPDLRTPFVARDNAVRV